MKQKNKTPFLGILLVILGTSLLDNLLAVKSGYPS